MYDIHILTMDKIKLSELTKEWIMTMIFDYPKTFDDLMRDGCALMIYGHKNYEDVEGLSSELISENKITRNQANQKLELTGKGIFEVKKKTILPLQKLTENHKYFEAFVVANKEKCDIEFLESLVGESDNEKINLTRTFSEQNYLKVSNIANLIGKFLVEHPEFAPGGDVPSI